MKTIKAHQQAIADALEKAMRSLGIGMSSLDVWKREMLEQIIVQLANERGTEVADLCGRAVERFRSALTGQADKRPGAA